MEESLIQPLSVGRTCEIISLKEGKPLRVYWYILLCVSERCFHKKLIDITCCQEDRCDFVNQT